MRKTILLYLHLYQDSHPVLFDVTFCLCGLIFGAALIILFDALEENPQPRWSGVVLLATGICLWKWLELSQFFV